MPAAKKAAKTVNPKGAAKKVKRAPAARSKSAAGKPKPRKKAAAARPKKSPPPPERPATPPGAAMASWIPLPPLGAPAGQISRPFDAATGAWLPPAPATPPPAPVALPPSAYRRGATRSLLLNVMLGIVLGLLAFNFLAGVAVGIVLLAAPDSELAQDFESASLIDSPLDLAIQALIMFALVGFLPFLWVLGTRVVPWRGTVEYLRLRVQARDWVRGLVLVPLMFVAVIALSAAYICITQGCAAFTQESDAESPGIEALTQNLNWPVAILVALGAGIGEEILFRGVLQRWIGVWGQAIAFGLAHAGNAYVPQVLFAAGLGVAFGMLYKRGWSLVSLMVAHAVYDFVLLALTLLYPELG